MPRLFAGMKVVIGEEEFIVPPLSLGDLRSGVLVQLKEHDELVANGNPFEAMQLRGEIILVALKRNYPDFPEQKLWDWLDVSNIRDLWMAVLGNSGFTPGEAQAATTEKINGISSPSIGALPPPTDGRTLQ